MLREVPSAALIGIEAHPVQVEVNTGYTATEGEVQMTVVGLPDTAVRESVKRVQSALACSGFQRLYHHTTINLAPGSLRKEGPCFDLPIALGMLGASDQTAIASNDLAPWLIAGELSLSGKTRPVRGAIAMAILARRLGKRGLILPPESAREAALLDDLPVYAVDSLDAAVRLLEHPENARPLDPANNPFHRPRATGDGVDFAEIKGQPGVRRAVEVAVAGFHNLLMLGPPGSGKSMIAQRIPTIMPEPTLEEYLEILQVYSAAGMTLANKEPGFQRPTRSPHHTISDVGLLGGGSIPGPGEISLAHNGVLFLDELPEFKRSALEVLRQPLEDGQVTISRSAGKITLPCRFMLIAAMNPTPSGYQADDPRGGGASVAAIRRYRAKVSGPLLDRIDIHVEAPAVSVSELRTRRDGESSAVIRERVIGARERQARRLAGHGLRHNAAMPHRLIRRYCTLGSSEGDLLEEAMDRLRLSARAYDRILKVSRTIADLEDAPAIAVEHLMEAIQYRSLDRDLLAG
ncbi:MAG: YifB family Mg chelatase-like AAA ATPase [Opitutales bacterium]